MKGNIIAATILSLLVGSSIAAPQSSAVHFAGGEINPTKQLEISLSKLIPDINYNLTCNIIDANNAKNQVTLYFNSNDTLINETPMLNEKQFYEGTQQKLTRVQNILYISEIVISPAAKNPLLLFRNADQDDSITISNCVAIAN